MEYFTGFAGFIVGSILTSIFYIIRYRCEHDWEDIGDLNLYGYGNAKFPVAIYDVYKCKKCKKNKREER